jgi:mannose-6-phosphate isomerase class I
MSRNFFRARPWFEPGPWGGQWIKRHIPELVQEVPNYAWSFELITPENGIMLSDGRYLLEITFDFLMFHDRQAILGDHADQFGDEFPIRFDYLDTFDGGNLSVQCHPRLDYIRKHFGEQITQDETYYILDCMPDARVYLGFKQDTLPADFRAAVETSRSQGIPLDVDRFINSEPAHRHDLFLIPNGTIHCSGVNNLVLEISATPYIFTFKLYDWLRRDLNGQFRILNVERAFENLNFDRRGERIREELVSKPQVIEQGIGWQIVHLPTHPEHFYDVHRLEFNHQMEVNTEGSCHVLCLVEGQNLLLETAEGMSARFSYAETFVIPASARSYRLTSLDKQPLKVIKAFLKRELPFNGGKS